MLLGSHDQSNKSMEGSVKRAVKLGSELPVEGDRALIISLLASNYLLLNLLSAACCFTVEKFAYSKWMLI